MTRLSIVIPAYNEAQRIPATLSMLAPARARGAEIVVVDGASDDGTAAMAAGAADRIINAERGRATQLNAGARNARGSALLFLHADSIVPDGIDRIVLDALGDRSLAWGRFDVRIDSTRRALAVVGAMMNWRSRLSGIATGDQGIFATRELFERAGGFPQQPIMEDIAFSRTAKRLAAPICLRAKIATSGRRWERHGVVSTVLLMWRLRLAYFLGADPHELALRYDHAR